MMNSRDKMTLFMTSIAISVIMASPSAYDLLTVDVSAQSINGTDSPLLTTNDSQGTGGLIPESELQSIREQTQSTNATGFAIGEIINQTRAALANTTMESLIEETNNTNATTFATDSIINQTQLGSNTTGN